MTAMLAIVLSLVFLPLGLAKIAGVRVMRRAAAHLGMSTGFCRVVGVLEVAGVAGLLMGLAGRVWAWPPLQASLC